MRGFGLARRRTWLVGRAALKPLLQQMSLPPDSSFMQFPHKQISLSHSGNLAIAVGSLDHDLSGLGVDLETVLDLNPRTGRFFLTEAEIEALDGGLKELRLAELWTVKEAIFKSDLRNQHRLLSDYQIIDWPNKSCCGWATSCLAEQTQGNSNCSAGTARFQFCLLNTAIGNVALATRRWRKIHAYEERALAS